MGDAKRRKQALGEVYGNPDQERIVDWFPLTRAQARRANEWTKRGAWAGIIIMVGYWVTVRFIGPALGLWAIAPLD